MLIKKYNLIHLSTGDILRSELANETELGVEAKKFMDQGLLVPDEVVIGMIGTQLEKYKDAKGFIFDGFPRTVPQAQELDKLFERKNMNLDIVLSLEVSEGELVKRLLKRGINSGRKDDQNKDIILNRIQVYNKQTSILKDYYIKIALSNLW